MEAQTSDFFYSRSQCLMSIPLNIDVKLDQFSEEHQWITVEEANQSFDPYVREILTAVKKGQKL